MNNCIGDMCPNDICALQYEPQGTCWLSDESKVLADKISHYVFEECNHEYDMSIRSPEYKKLLDFSENYVIELRRAEIENELNRIFEEAEKEYPDLAIVYNDLTAGYASAEHLIWEYNYGGGIKAILMKTGRL